MEDPNHPRSAAAYRQSVPDPYVFGREVASYIDRYLWFYTANLKPPGPAIVYEEVAARLSGEAEIFRSR